MVHVALDSYELYYLTQYLPVYQELQRRGVESSFVAYHTRPEALESMRRFFARTGLPVRWFETKEAGLEHYRREAPEWVLFGNGYIYTDQLPASTRTAVLYHGIGMKSDVYAPRLVQHDVRFVEGPHYVRKLSAMYPGCNLVSVGYAKTDPLFWPQERRPRFDLAGAGLDPSRPTILYAPTHAPSSFALMSDDFPADFGAWNVIVKPHYLSFFSSTRRSHRRLMELWSRAPNCYVASLEEFDPVPFMNVSDLLISDASSVLFEFAATGKPVVLCDFLALPWYRRGIFSYRLRKRLDGSIDVYRDLAGHAASYAGLRAAVADELAHPERHADARRRATEQLIGATDGRVAERIVDWLLANVGPTTRTRVALAGA